jgi:hypothetical protein
VAYTNRKYNLRNKSDWAECQVLVLERSRIVKNSLFEIEMRNVVPLDSAIPRAILQNHGWWNARLFCCLWNQGVPTIGRARQVASRTQASQLRLRPRSERFLRGAAFRALECRPEKFGLTAFRDKKRITARAFDNECPVARRFRIGIFSHGCVANRCDGVDTFVNIFILLAILITRSFFRLFFFYCGECSAEKVLRNQRIMRYISDGNAK